MHKVNDAIVNNGQVTLSHLPFADGQHVRVMVTEVGGKLPLSHVRELLKGKVIHFDDPMAPMIPDNSWEMRK